MTEEDSPRATLVVGGARSGKSRFAEGLADMPGLSKIYVATATPFDDEMSERIAAHRRQRGDGWKTVEEQFDLDRVLMRECLPGRIVLVDCLTLWLSNLLFRDMDVAHATEELVDTVGRLKGSCIFVSNETGMGIVPESRLSRQFRDAQGRLNQELARVCAQVVFVAAGLPLLLKPNAQPEIRP